MILDYFLQLPLLVIIIGVSLLITLVSTLAYKYFTNQAEMKSLKDDIKKHQDEMKGHKDNPKKVMEIQKKAMEKNFRYMGQSMKPMLITFLPIILVFAWLNQVVAYEPLMPGQDFTITAGFDKYTGNATLTSIEGLTINNPTQDVINGTASWTANGKTGEYLLSMNVGGRAVDAGKVTVTDQKKYAPVLQKINDNSLKTIVLPNKPTKPFGWGFSIFGYRPGWLMTYIIFSIIFSMGLRKVMKVY